MQVLLIILAIIGLAFLILVAIGAMNGQEAAPPVEDLAAPYREGLQAAVRMQRVAQDLEQQIYAEAAQAMQGEAERE